MMEWNSKEWRNQFSEVMKVHSHEQVRQLHKQAFEATKRVVMKEKAYTSGYRGTRGSAFSRDHGEGNPLFLSSIRRTSCGAPIARSMKWYAGTVSMLPRCSRTRGMNTVVLNSSQCQQPEWRCRDGMLCHRRSSSSSEQT